jgi:peptide/nickel transport system substrate-binding protein
VTARPGGREGIRRTRRLAVLLATAAAISGCGGDEAATSPPPAPGSGGEAGELVYALASGPRDLDPLLSASPAGRTVSRQIHEPLVDIVRPPFGQPGRKRGLAVAWSSSRDRRVWSFRLRRRVRFQDGTPFNATAVLANAERWDSLAAGRRLLPGLLAVDAPRPDLVRFLLSRPVAELPVRLRSARLGLVSPRALGSGGRLAGDTASGTGAFELRERRAGRELVLALHDGWWGRRAGLGPALEVVRFLVTPDEGDRLALLRSGEAQVAEGLGPASIAALAAEPLLTLVPAGSGSALGLERSVRGIEDADPPVLSSVWLTRVGGD